MMAERSPAIIVPRMFPIPASPSLVDRGGGLVDRGRLVDDRGRLDNRRRGLHHHRGRRDDVVHQVHDPGGEAEAVAVVVVVACGRRRGAMRMMRRPGPVHLVHGRAAVSSMSAAASSMVAGGGEGCAAKGEACEGCHDEFLVVVHNAPSLSFLLVSGARPSRAHIEEGLFALKT